LSRALATASKIPERFRCSIRAGTVAERFVARASLWRCFSSSMKGRNSNGGRSILEEWGLVHAAGEILHRAEFCAVAAGARREDFAGSVRDRGNLFVAIERRLADLGEDPVVVGDVRFVGIEEHAVRVEHHEFNHVERILCATSGRRARSVGEPQRFNSSGILVTPSRLAAGADPCTRGPCNRKIPRTVFCSRPAGRGTFEAGEFGYLRSDRGGGASREARAAFSQAGTPVPREWEGEGTERFAAVVRVRCVAPLPPRSFGARRPPLGQGEVIWSGPRWNRNAVVTACIRGGCRRALGRTILGRGRGKVYILEPGKT